MIIFWFIYNILVIPLIYFFFLLGSIFNDKIKAGLLGRTGTFRRLKNFISNRDKTKEIIFIHSASLGEWEQAVPIINKIKEQSDSYIFIASFFSPSGFKTKIDDFVDLKIYLPLDDRFSARKLFSIMKPRLWIISKYDIWPNMIFAAKSHNVEILLASAELADNSIRFKGILKLLNRNIYEKIDAVSCVSESHMNNFKNIYTSEKLYAFGDCRYDRIYDKSEKITRDASINVFKDAGISFIAGSIWKEDEKIIFPAIVKLLNEEQSLQVILVPHEINATDITQIKNYFETNSFPVQCYSELAINEYSDCRIVIIDKIGILASIYKDTTIAYVGGGFGKGVHNVMEPTAFFQPVLFGPNHINSHEACQLNSLGGGFSIGDEDTFYGQMKQLLSDKEELEKASNIAGNFLLANLGATDKVMELLKREFDIH